MNFINIDKKAIYNTAIQKENKKKKKKLTEIKFGGGCLAGY